MASHANQAITFSGDQIPADWTPICLVRLGMRPSTVTASDLITPYSQGVASLVCSTNKFENLNEVVANEGLVPNGGAALLAAATHFVYPADSSFFASPTAEQILPVFWSTIRDAHATGTQPNWDALRPTLGPNYSALVSFARRFDIFEHSVLQLCSLVSGMMLPYFFIYHTTSADCHTIFVHHSSIAGAAGSQDNLSFRVLGVSQARMSMLAEIPGLIPAPAPASTPASSPAPTPVISVGAGASESLSLAPGGLDDSEIKELELVAANQQLPSAPVNPAFIPYRAPSPTGPSRDAQRHSGAMVGRGYSALMTLIAHLCYSHQSPWHGDSDVPFISAAAPFGHAAAVPPTVSARNAVVGGVSALGFYLKSPLVYPEGCSMAARAARSPLAIRDEFRLPLPPAARPRLTAAAAAVATQGGSGGVRTVELHFTPVLGSRALNVPVADGDGSALPESVFCSGTGGAPCEGKALKSLEVEWAQTENQPWFAGMLD